jgi:hypothetical protein
MLRAGIHQLFLFILMPYFDENVVNVNALGSGSGQRGSSHGLAVA